MAKRRRTQQIQRRTRASDEALSRPLTASRGFDPRLLIVIGVLVVGVIVLAFALIAFSGSNPAAGERQQDQGGTHIPNCQPGNYSSVPPTSGCHSDPPAGWGVYASPQDQVQLIHNLEHGGIVIWYQPDQLEADAVASLTDWAEGQIRSTRFKVIVSPWEGADFGHPIAVTAWNYLLYQDVLDLGQIQGFMDAHYGRAPEPNGGPAQPAT